MHRPDADAGRRSARDDVDRRSNDRTDDGPADRDDDDARCERRQRRRSGRRTGIRRTDDHLDCHTYGDPDCHAYGDSDCHTDSDSDCHAYGDSDCHAYGDSDCHTDSDSDCHATSRDRDARRRRRVRRVRIRRLTATIRAADVRLDAEYSLVRADTDADISHRWTGFRRWHFVPLSEPSSGPTVVSRKKIGKREYNYILYFSYRKVFKKPL
jgi:hypothetical protein